MAYRRMENDRETGLLVEVGPEGPGRQVSQSLLGDRSRASRWHPPPASVKFTS